VKSTFRDYLKYQAPVILWGVLIFTISSIPRLAPLKRSLPHIDKIGHGFEYFVFGYLLARALYYAGRSTIRPRAIRLALILGVVFAGLDELHQIFVPGRVESLSDFAADTTGLLLALGLFRWRHRHGRVDGVSPPLSGGGEQADA